MIDVMYQDRKDEAEAPLRTITLSGPDLRAATRLLTLLSGREDNRPQETYATGRVHADPGSIRDRAVLIERARRTFVGRQRRSQIFSNAMFGEPAWDMLLALYVAEQSGARHTIVRLLSQSGAPATTALRWLDYLEKERLVTRHANPVDRRTSFVALTEKARTALDVYFSGTIVTEI